jgi:N-acetyl-anhydromuramyl-L-alanine amidase AmpD
MNAFKFIPIVLFLIFFNNEFSFSQVEKLNHSLKDLEYIEKTTYSSESVNTRIRFVVIHYTSTNWEQSLKILTKADYEVSSHYLIPESFDETYKEKNLYVYKIVDENDRAWHAGESSWQGRNHINDQSIGIELVNNSECYYQPDNKELNYKENYLCSFYDYDPKQIQLLIKTIKPMLKRHDEIKPTHIIGHSDIAPNRKYDPGPRFPWFTLYQNGIGAWYDNEIVDKYWQEFTTIKMPIILDIQCALKSYGYKINLTGIEDKQTDAVVRSFHYHFRPWDTKGDIDVGTASTLWALLEKYMPNVIDANSKIICVKE